MVTSRLKTDKTINPNRYGPCLMTETLPPPPKKQQRIYESSIKGRSRRLSLPLLLDQSVTGVFCLLKAERNNIVRLLLGSHETFSIIWIGKPVSAIQSQFGVQRCQVGAKHCRGGRGRRGKDNRKQKHWPHCLKVKTGLNFSLQFKYNYIIITSHCCLLVSSPSWRVPCAFCFLMTLDHQHETKHHTVNPLLDR